MGVGTLDVFRCSLMMGNFKRRRSGHDQALRSAENNFNFPPVLSSVSPHLRKPLVRLHLHVQPEFCFHCRNEVSHIGMVQISVRTGSAAFNEGIISKAFGCHVLFDATGYFWLHMPPRAN